MLLSLSSPVLFWLFAFDRVPDARSKVESARLKAQKHFHAFRVEKPWRKSHREKASTVLKSPALKVTLEAFLFVFDLFGKNKNCNENCKEEKNFSALLSSKMSKTFRLVFLSSVLFDVSGILIM